MVTKKPPVGRPAASRKMERAKRLEINSRSEEVPLNPTLEKKDVPSNTQIDTPAAAELREINDRWSELAPEIKHAVLALVLLGR